MKNSRSLIALAGTVLVAVAAFALILPEREQYTPEGQSWLSHIPEVAAAESLHQARVDSMIELRTLLRRLEMRAAVRALPPAAEMLALTEDPRVPADTRAAVGAAVRAEFAEYPVPVGPVRVHLAADDEQHRGRYTRYIVLPAGPEDACTVLIELPLTPTRVTPRPGERLLGTCGFYARFGVAGPGMRSWLETTRAEAAAADVLPLDSAATSGEPRRQHRMAATDVVYLPAAAGCAADSDAACVSLFDYRWRGRRARGAQSTIDARARDVIYGDASYPLSSGSTHLAAMRAQLGDARFVEVWRSELPPAAAYEALEARSVGGLVRAQLLREIEPYRPGPLSARFPLLLGLGVAGLCAGVTIRAVRRRRS